MATYKSDAGAILEPGNQINRLSSFNHEGVKGWPGVEAFELIGFHKVSTKSGSKANHKSFNITIPSPDRRPDDRVRSDRSSLVVNASSDRPAYIQQASIGVGQDIPANGLAAATSSLAFSSTKVAQGSSAVSAAKLPFWTSVTTSGIDDQDAANSMMYKVTANTTFKIYNVNGVTSTTVDGDGVFITDDDHDAGKAAYIICRVNYLRPAAGVSFNDIQGFIDFASQVGGTDS